MFRLENILVLTTHIISTWLNLVVCLPFLILAIPWHLGLNWCFLRCIYPPKGFTILWTYRHLAQLTQHQSQMCKKVSKDFRVQKFLGAKTFEVHEDFGSKRICGPKFFFGPINFGSKKILGLSKSWVEEYLGTPIPATQPPVT